jgi:hypothetical protein
VETAKEARAEKQQQQGGVGELVVVLMGAFGSVFLVGVFGWECVSTATTLA